MIDVMGEGACENLIEAGGAIEVDLGEMFRGGTGLDALGVGSGGEGFEVATVELEGTFAGEEFPEEDADREEVGAVIEFCRSTRVAGVEGFELFGGHVGEAAAEISFGGDIADVFAEADVEVGELGEAFSGEENVGRFEIAMEDSAGVGGFESAGEASPHPADEFGPGHGGDTFAK